MSECANCLRLREERRNYAEHREKSCTRIHVYAYIRQRTQPIKPNTIESGRTQAHYYKWLYVCVEGCVCGYIVLAKRRK